MEDALADIWDFFGDLDPITGWIIAIIVAVLLIWGIRLAMRT